MRLILFNILVIILLSGCNIPYDTANTFVDSRTEPLRVGVVKSLDSLSEVFISEKEMMEQFINRNNLKGRYFYLSETQLVKLMEQDSLDVIIGSFTKKTLWKKKAALTRPYDKKHVWLVKKGENRLVFEIEKFFHNQIQSDEEI